MVDRIAAIAAMLDGMGRFMGRREAWHAVQGMAVLTTSLTDDEVGPGLDLLLDASIAGGWRSYWLLGPRIAELADRVDDEKRTHCLHRLLRRLETVEGRNVSILAVPIEIFAERQMDERVPATLGCLIRAMGRIDGEWEPQEALVEIAQKLAARLGPDHALRARDQIAGGVVASSSPYALRALLKSAEALPTPLDERQARAALDSAVRCAEQTTSGFAFGSLAIGIAAIPQRLGPDQAMALARNFVRIAEGPGDVSYHLLTEAASRLAGRFEPCQATDLAPLVIDGILRADRPRLLQALIAFLRVLPVRLTELDARRIFGHLASLFDRTTASPDVAVLAESFAAVPAQPSEAELQAATRRLLSEPMNDPASLHLSHRAAAIGAIGPLLPAALAAKATGVITEGFKGATDSPTLRALAQALEKLPGQPAAGELDHAVATLVLGLGQEQGMPIGQGRRVSALGQAAQSLIRKLRQMTGANN